MATLLSRRPVGDVPSGCPVGTPLLRRLVGTLVSRRVIGILSALLLPVVTVTAFAGPAHADDGYQYWNYFHLQKGEWAFSQTGVAAYKPKDGAVEGFRYGTSTTSKGIEPRADLSHIGFAAICGEGKAPAGRKRVAVLLDFGSEKGHGTPPDPRADCAVVDGPANTLEVLDTVAQVRSQKGMLCALDGYPATGCGEPVKNATVPTHEQTVSFAMPGKDSGSAAKPAAASQRAEDGSNTGAVTVVAVAVLVVLIAVGALVIGRRAKRS